MRKITHQEAQLNLSLISWIKYLRWTKQEIICVTLVGAQGVEDETKLFSYLS